MKQIVNKIVIGGLGLALLVTGLATVNAKLEHVPSAILLGLGAIFLFGSVGWSTFFDRKKQDTDVSNALLAILGVILGIAALLIGFTGSVWSWLPVNWIAGIVGVIIMLFALFKV